MLLQDSEWSVLAGMQMTTIIAAAERHVKRQTEMRHRTQVSEALSAIISLGNCMECIVTGLRDLAAHTQTMPYEGQRMLPLL